MSDNCIYCGGTTSKHKGLCGRCVSILDAGYREPEPLVNMNGAQREAAQKTLQRVCGHFQISLSTLFGPRATAAIVRPRHIAMLLLSQSGLGSKDIGRVMHRDHSSVIHACKTMNARVSVDPELAALVADLKG